MNRRHCVVGTLIITLLGVCSAGAHGQPTTGGTTTGGAATGGAATTAGASAPAGGAGAAVSAPVTVPQTAYANPTSSRAVIEDFVGRNVTNLMNDAEPALQAKARENLSQATMTAGAVASPEFQFEYGRALNNALSPKLNKVNKPTLRQRLNIAIVAARVAEKATNTTLQETTVKLINDPTEPVVLWGLKAAQPQLKEVIKSRLGAAMPPLLAVIVPAVFAHPSGPVFEEAYIALDVTDMQVMTELMKLWGNRLAQYQGKEAPDDPAVDARPVNTLASAAMWQTVLKAPPQQMAVMQMISDQMSVAAQWADKTPAGDQHDQLVKLVRQCGEACAVVGIHQAGKDKLKTASEPVTKLDPKSPATATLKLVPIIAPVISEIPTQFPGVKPPPVVGNGLVAP